MIYIYIYIWIYIYIYIHTYDINSAACQYRAMLLRWRGRSTSPDCSFSAWPGHVKTWLE